MIRIVIVQARMTSRRFPGKVVADLAGKPVLEHVLERCRKIKADLVGLAIPDMGASDPLRRIAKRLAVPVFAGSHEDVLSRYLHAYRHFERLLGEPVDAVMRITADCPLIDPSLCNKVFGLLEGRYEYAANCWPRTFPYGLDAEAFTVDALERAARLLTAAREHVTTLFTPEAQFVQANLSIGPTTYTQHRWLVDYPTDLDFLREVFAIRVPTDFTDMLQLLSEHPDLYARSCRPPPDR